MVISEPIKEEQGLVMMTDAKYEPIRVPEDVYDAVFVGFKTIKEGIYGARLGLLFEFKFKENPVILTRIVYNNATPDSYLGKTLISLGVKFETGKSVNLNDLIGSECRIVVKDYEDKNGDIRSGINDVMKARAG